MAKKSSGFGWGKIAGFLAFFALFITGINWIVSLIVGLVGGDFDLGWLTTIASICLVASVFISAWFFICSTSLPGKKLYWQIALIVFAVLAACGVIGIGIK